MVSQTRCTKCKNSECAGLFRPGEVTKTSSDTEFDVAAVDIHWEQKAGKAATVPSATGVGTHGVARQFERRNSSNDDTNWSVGLGVPQTPDQYPDLLVGTARTQLPMLLTESHLSAGRLARVRKLDKQLSNEWLAGLETADLEAAQQHDPDISPVLTWIKDGTKPPKTDLARAVRKQRT